jgi:hypothetical protein
VNRFAHRLALRIRSRFPGSTAVWQPDVHRVDHLRFTHHEAIRNLWSVEFVALTIIPTALYCPLPAGPGATGSRDRARSGCAAANDRLSRMVDFVPVMLSRTARTAAPLEHSCCSS